MGIKMDACSTSSSQESLKHQKKDVQVDTKSVQSNEETTAVTDHGSSAGESVLPVQTDVLVDQDMDSKMQC